MRDLDEHQAECEEEAPPEEETQGPPSSGTPPGPPPPWNPRETPSTGQLGRVQEAVQRIEGPPIVSVPAPKWRGWKTQTGPTIADVEQSRMSPFGEQESEMPDANLREAMIRSMQETRRDPHEIPITGGASGSGVATHAPSPQQASTPNTQSEGEGSVIPKGQSRIAVTSLQLPSDQITSSDVRLALEDRIQKQKGRVAELIQRMSSFDREATEADMIELNELKHSLAACQRSLDQVTQGEQVQAIPRPPVQLPRFGSPAQAEDEPMETRSSRSRPRPHVRGRSKADKRRHPDSGDRRPSRRRKGDPIMVMPQVTIPPPTVASMFQGGVEDLSSSCPTSQEPAVSVPFLFQTAGANLPLGGSPQATPPQSNIASQSGPPRDPRSQSERRRVSIQTPPTPDGVPEGQIPVPFGGRPLLPRSTSAEPQAPSGDYSVLQTRQDPHQQGRSTYYGR